MGRMLLAALAVGLVLAVTGYAMVRFAARATP